MSKILLVLAASVYQLPAIQTAKKMGYQVITVDNRPDNPGHDLADRSYYVDTTDCKSILSLAKKEHISVIIAPATDVAVSTAAYVSQRMQLPGIPFDSAVLLTNKKIFRQFLQKQNIPSPEALESDGMLDEVNFDADRMWIVKPAVSSGSKGVFIVRDKEELYSRLATSQAISLDGCAVLEEYIEGTQHTCEGILNQGKVCFALITDRDTAPSPYVTTIGHRVPSRLSLSLQSQTIQRIEEIFTLLDVHSGPFDCDFVVKDMQVIILEMTPRLGGNSLSRLVQTALGIDLVAYSVAHACGDIYDINISDINISQQIQPAAIVLFGVWQRGRLTWDDEAECEMLKEDWVKYLSFDVSQGAFVEPFINGRYRVGEALICADTRDELDRRVQICVDRLSLHSR